MSTTPVESDYLWEKLGFNIEEVVSCDISMSVDSLVTVRICKYLTTEESSRMIKVFEHYRLEEKPIKMYSAFRSKEKRNKFLRPYPNYHNIGTSIWSAEHGEITKN